MADDADTPVAPKPSWRRRHWRPITLALVILIPILLFAAWAGLTVSYAYSKGERAGYVQKIAQRGWICKTWEGELAMANLPGAMPEIFKFTVRNDSIARLIEGNLAKRVSVTYEEHRGVPGRCFGETPYYITNVRIVEN